MKKGLIVCLLLIIQILFIVVFSFAGNYDPFAGTAIEGLDPAEISSDELFETSLLIAHQVAELDVNDEKAFWAFLTIQSIFNENGVHRRYVDNEIQSTELRQLLTDLYASISNPQTAKDYFYRAILEYPEGYSREPVSGKMLEYAQYVIDNYPDTVYGEYSMLILANHYELDDDFTEAINKYNAYLTKYGANAKLKAYVYYCSATIYRRLYNRPGTYYNLTDIEGKLATMLDYANKIFTEFPDRKGIIGEISLDIAGYYKRIGDKDKALGYYKKIYEDPDPDTNYVNSAVYNAGRIYLERKDYTKAKEAFDYAESRYSNVSSFKAINKRFRLNLLEMKKFGYDSTDDSPQAQNIYNNKKAAIDAFRQQYEASWDADFNQIAPLPIP